jgi:hypothetical protein
MADSPDPTTTKPDPQHKVAAYQRVCESYHAVDDFRMKLLGLLPVATGTGVFLLLSGKSELVAGATSKEAVPETVRNALSAIGVFGFLFTLGLFAYELFGIKKCHYYAAWQMYLCNKRLACGEVRAVFCRCDKARANRHTTAVG